MGTIRAALLALLCALLCTSQSAAHSCIHDDVLADHDVHYWDRKLLGFKNESAPEEPEQLFTRRELHDLMGSQSSDAQQTTKVKRRQLETKAQYLARPWQPIRINVQFVNVGSDSQMDAAKTNFLTNIVIPQAVAKLEAALEVGRSPLACTFHFIRMPFGFLLFFAIHSSRALRRCDECRGYSSRSVAAARHGHLATATFLTPTTT